MGKSQNFENSDFRTTLRSKLLNHTEISHENTRLECWKVIFGDFGIFDFEDEVRGKIGYFWKFLVFEVSWKIESRFFWILCYESSTAVILFICKWIFSEHFMINNYLTDIKKLIWNWTNFQLPSSLFMIMYIGDATHTLSGLP